MGRKGGLGLKRKRGGQSEREWQLRDLEDKGT